MNRKGQKGSITVFLSLACILFLSLICAVVESARVQGAKAQTANITGMGTFSVMGEFERELLEKYDIFALDAAYEGGSFQIQKVTQKMEDYISYNANPKKNQFAAWHFDPWNLQLTDCSVKGYALLTDDRGEPFYQEAVAYMYTNIGEVALEKWKSFYQNVNEIKQNEQNYENNLENNDQQLEQLEQEQKEREAEAAAAASASEASSGDIVVIESSGSAAEVTTQTEAEVENPLPIIASLRRGPIIRLVTGNKELSEKKISRSGFPSKKIDRKGNMEVEKKYSGIDANLLFREYLMMYFPNYRSGSTDKVLDYQLEYILGGKDNDLSNLKHVVNLLLLAREGMNYLYSLSNSKMRDEAEVLATGITAVFANPALTEVTKHALLLAWSFGESLLDIRVLLAGGKVPLIKDTSSWSLSLNNLGQVVDILQNGGTKQSQGMSYDEYLRIFLYMGNVREQRLRALDLIQAELKKEKDTAEFKAENCIVAIKAETQWSCRPIFFSLPKVVMGLSAGNVTFVQQSSMAY